MAVQCSSVIIGMCFVAFYALSILPNLQYSIKLRYHLILILLLFMLYQYYISFATFYCSKSTLNFYYIYNKYLIKIRPDSNFNIYRLMILITFLSYVLK